MCYEVQGERHVFDQNEIPMLGFAHWRLAQKVARNIDVINIVDSHDKGFSRLRGVGAKNHRNFAFRGYLGYQGIQRENCRAQRFQNLSHG